MKDLLQPSQIPGSFSYSPDFLRVVECGIIDLLPWRIIQGEELSYKQEGLQKRYDGRSLVAFARRIDNDDVACWDLDTGDIAIVHDYASPGWEQRTHFPDFKSWLRAAFEEFIDYE